MLYFQTGDVILDGLTYLTILGLLVYLVKKEKKKEERFKALEAKLEAVKVETIRAINQ